MVAVERDGSNRARCGSAACLTNGLYRGRSVTAPRIFGHEAGTRGRTDPCWHDLSHAASLPRASRGSDAPNGAAICS